LAFRLSAVRRRYQLDKGNPGLLNTLRSGIDVHSGDSDLDALVEAAPGFLASSLRRNVAFSAAMSYSEFAREHQ